MSVRIHEISKQTGIPSKDLIELLQDRGFKVSTASSGIDPISAESLIKELIKQQTAAGSTDTATEAPAAEASAQEATEAPAEPKAPPAPPPIQHFVKTAKEIEDEKEEKRKQEEASRKSAVVAPPPAAPTPAAPAPSAPPPPPPVQSAPPPPPPVKAPPAAPAPVAVPPVKTPPVAAPAPVAPPPVKAPSVAAPAPVTPPPVSSPAPSAPPPVAAPAPMAPPPVGGAPKGPSAPPPPPAIGSKPPVSAPPAADKPAEEEAAGEAGELKIITLKPPIVIKEFASTIGLKPFRLISELMEMSIFASMNSVLEEDVATKVAEKHGFLLEIRHRGEEKAPAPVKKKKEKKEEDDDKFLEPRPPVLCILGHVDHGKTTLIDFIRKANVVAGEAGGITQHVAAYQVEHAGKKITFLDTPGHAAFSKMRARGATVTDIAILVVAADDGFMPQTDEALKYAQNSGVPVIVAINKIDSKGANIDRVKTQMQERGIPPEDWGGETICVAISALKGENIDELMDMINLQAEVLELKANPKGGAKGVIIESQIEVGRGSTATVIVNKGTLKSGDALVCGTRYAKVRTMVDEYGKPVKSAPPSTPVRIAGWDSPPRAGQEFETVKNEREARRIAEERDIEEKRQKPEEKEAPAPMDLDAFLASIDAAKKQVYKLILKCDVHGSGEAIVDMLSEIQSDKVDLEVINWDVGVINKTDIMMASSSGAAIIGFNVKLDNGVQALAKHHGVNIQQYSIIYQMVDRIKEAMADLLEPDKVENRLGAAEVRQVFPLAKGFVAGCIVNDGRMARDAKARLTRKGELLCESRVVTLKRFKDDVNEVRNGYECGIRLDNFDGYEEGDVIECFEIEKRRASL